MEKIRNKDGYKLNYKVIKAVRLYNTKVIHKVVKVYSSGIL